MAKAPEQGPARRPAKRPKTPGSGRKRGTPNKKTSEKDRAAKLELERLDLMNKAIALNSDVDKAKAAGGTKLIKEIGFDMTRLAAGLAAFYQPWPQWSRDPETNQLRNANPNYDEGRFKYYLEASIAGAAKFADYESPKLAAVVVKQEIVNEIEVRGGMPDEFAAPEPGRAVLEPGTIVPAEDDRPEQRVVNGEIVPFPGATPKTGTES